VTNTGQDETSAPTVVSREADVADVDESASAPSPAWGAAAL
jgi:cell division inhibitor SepF